MPKARFPKDFLKRCPFASLSDTSVSKILNLGLPQLCRWNFSFLGCLKWNYKLRSFMCFAKHIFLNGTRRKGLKKSFSILLKWSLNLFNTPIVKLHVHSEYFYKSTCFKEFKYWLKYLFYIYISEAESNTLRYCKHNELIKHRLNSSTTEFLWSLYVIKS